MEREGEIKHPMNISLCGCHDLYEYLDFYDGGRVGRVLGIFRPALVRPLVLHLDVLDLDQRLKTFSYVTDARAK